MPPENSDTTFETTEFLLACYLRAKGVQYLTTKRLDEKRVVFVFQQPPEDILSSWLSATETVSARALHSAMNFFRDEMRGVM